MVYSRKSIRSMNTLNKVKRKKLRRKDLESDGISKWKGKDLHGKWAADLVVKGLERIGIEKWV